MKCGYVKNHSCPPENRNQNHIVVNFNESFTFIKAIPPHNPQNVVELQKRCTFLFGYSSEKTWCKFSLNSQDWNCSFADFSERKGWIYLKVNPVKNTNLRTGLTWRIQDPTQLTPRSREIAQRQLTPRSRQIAQIQLAPKPRQIAPETTRHHDNLLQSNDKSPPR